jgi:hypothetical protein
MACASLSNLTNNSKEIKKVIGIVPIKPAIKNDNEVLKHISVIMNDTLVNENDDNNLNLVVMNILVGSNVPYSVDRQISRELNHMFPLIVEKLLLELNSVITKSTYKNFSIKENITIIQHVVCIDPLFGLPNFEMNEENMLPEFLIEHLTMILPKEAQYKFNIVDNYILLTQINEEQTIKCYLEFHFIPLATTSNFLKLLVSSYEVLNTIIPNVLFTYFDFSGQDYDYNPTSLIFDNPKIYALSSDCMMDICEPITIPLINYIDDEYNWWTLGNFGFIEKMKFPIDENPAVKIFAKRFYDYFYRGQLINIINTILPYLNGSTAYHIATGEGIQLERIPFGIDFITQKQIQDFLLPFIKYRIGNHPNRGLIEWYFSKFYDIRTNRRAYLCYIQHEKSIIKLDPENSTLLDFVRLEMEFLSGLFQ